MSEIRPSEFSQITGLSAKALRLYAERGLLVPAFVDPVSGYRRYSEDQVVVARRIALLRRAGIGLADIRRFLASPAGEVIEGWMTEIRREARHRSDALAAIRGDLGLSDTKRGRDEMTMLVVRPVRTEQELVDAWASTGGDPNDQQRLEDLRRALIDEPDLLLAAYDDQKIAGAALGFTAGCNWATLRGFGLDSAHDDQRVASQLLAAFETAARARGADGVALGGGDEDDVAFYVARSYRTHLLLQWVHDPAQFGDETQALLSGPLEGMEHFTGEFNGVPQLFVALDEPDVTTRSVVADLVDGAHVGYCMMRRLSDEQ